MCFDVFLQILRPFERFTTELAFVRFERNVDSNMRGYVVAFYGSCSTRTPLASEV